MKYFFIIWRLLPFTFRDHLASARERRKQKHNHKKFLKNKIKCISDHLSAKKPIIYFDIGANKGGFLDELTPYYKMDKVILVEPIPDAAIYLKKKYPSNICSIYQNVISDQENINVDFIINEFSETSSLFEIRSEMEELSKINTKPVAKQKIISRTLDGIFFESKISKIDLLKIDVQGAENLVILGGKEALKNTKYLWIELSLKPIYKGSPIFSDVYALLQERDFVLLELSPGFRAPNNDELIQVDALFLNTKFE